MWGKIVPESIEKEPLEKLGSKTIYEKYDSKGAPPGVSDTKESTYNAGDPGSIPGLGRSPGEENGYPLHVLARRIPWTEEPGGLQSKELQRVGHN